MLPIISAPPTDVGVIDEPVDAHRSTAAYVDLAIEEGRNSFATPAYSTSLIVFMCC
jgi:hypothetical protein